VTRLRRDSLLVLGLMIAVCLLGGLVFGVATGKWAHTGIGATPTSIRTQSTLIPIDQLAVSGEQKSLLIVGVEDASASQPVLEGCWVLSYRPGINEYYFLSFPPDTNFHLASLGKSQTLAEIYAWDLSLQLGFRFMGDAIESRFPPLKPQAEVIIDRLAVAELVTRAGGLSLQGNLLDGAQILDRYAAQGTSERMAFQETVVLALFKRLGENNWTPDALTLFFQQWPGSHAMQLDSFAAGAPALADSGVHWTVYTPDLETSTAP
jgi:hypothetical protein